MILHGITNLALMLIYAAPPAPQTVAPFPDMPRDHWANQAVMDLKQRGILLGYPAAPVYDLSTPIATWKSLLKAMRNRDENAIYFLRTWDVFNVSDTFQLSVSNKKRLEIYARWAKHWSQWDFEVDQTSSVDAQVGSKVRAAATSKNAEPFQFPMPGFWLIFLKTSQGWKLDAIWHDLD